MNDKIVVYTDGSYKENLRIGGWAYAYFLSPSETNIAVAYGQVEADSSESIEIIAMIKAIANIPSTKYEIEILTDNLSVANKFSHGDFQDKSMPEFVESFRGITLKNYKSWNRLIQIIKYTGRKVRIKKIKKGYGLNNIVHQAARIGLKCKNIKPGVFYLKQVDLSGFVESADLDVELVNT